MYPVLNITKDYDAKNSVMSSTIGHEETDFLESCKLAYKYNYKGINVDLENPLYSIQEMQMFLAEYNLQPTSFHLSLKLNSTDSDFIDSLKLFKKQAKDAAKLGCLIALKYIPPFSEDFNFTENFKLHIARLSAIRNILIDNNIKIAFEFIGPPETRINTKYDFIHTIDGVRALISSADLYKYAGFKLDVHHWQHSGATLVDLKHLDLDYILYLELNDGLIGYDKLTIPEFRRTLPLKTGVNDIKGFLKAIYEKGFRGPVALEPWDSEISSLPLEEAIRITKRSLDDCLELVK